MRLSTLPSKAAPRLLFAKHCIWQITGSFFAIQLWGHLVFLLQEAEVGKGVHMGPYARLRTGTVLSDGVRIGNFVEIKNANLGEGAMAAHLT